MDRNILMGFLSQSDFDADIRTDFSNDYLFELCGCVIQGISREAYQKFLGRDPGQEGKADTLKKWREELLQQELCKDASSATDVKQSEAYKQLEKKWEASQKRSKAVEATAENLSSEKGKLQAEVIRKNKENAELKETLEKAEGQLKKQEAALKTLENDRRTLYRKNRKLEQDLKANLIEHTQRETKKLKNRLGAWSGSWDSPAGFISDLFIREKELDKEQQAFVLECLEKKVPYNTVWQNVSAGLDVGIMRRMVRLAGYDLDKKQEKAEGAHE